MKVDQIRAFLLIVNEGSFRAAAESMHKTQPAITKNIHALEASLGFELFDRTAYHPTLTELGATFYEGALHFYKQYERLSHLKNSLKNKIEPLFSIGVDVCLPLTKISNLLSSCFEMYPETQFVIEACTLNGGNESLLQGTMDMVICEHIYLDEPLEALPLIDIPLVPVATVQYAQQYGLLLNDPEKAWATQQIILADSAKVDKKSFGVIGGHRQIVVNDLSYKLSLILGGIGWGRMPDWMVKEHIAKNELTILEYPHIAKRNLKLSVIRKKSTYYGKVNMSVWNELSVDLASVDRSLGK